MRIQGEKRKLLTKFDLKQNRGTAALGGAGGDRGPRDGAHFYHVLDIWPPGSSLSPVIPPSSP